MVALAQVIALVDAHVNRDYARFRAVSLQIAAHAAGRSDRGAEQIRKLVVQPQTLSFEPSPSLNGLLSSPSGLSTLDDMALSVSTRSRLNRIVLEYGQRGLLHVHGLSSARKLLFTGPPGVGKTLASRALAQAIGLPMFRVDLHGVISQHLGETASKLSKVFEHVRMMPAVYLFDEFDALGAERSSLGGDAAGAEMRRVVNSVLQFIEDDRSESLIVAATNHSQLLDRAIFRRFDETILFALPSREEVVELFRRVSHEGSFEQADLDAIFSTVAGLKLGHADVCAALDRVLKDHVLTGSPIDTPRVIESLKLRTCVGQSEIIS